MEVDGRKSASVTNAQYPLITMLKCHKCKSVRAERGSVNRYRESRKDSVGRVDLRYDQLTDVCRKCLTTPLVQGSI